MYLVNLVPLILLVSVLTESGVDAVEHLRKPSNDLREKIRLIMDKFIEYSINGDTNALVNLHSTDGKLLMDGMPPIVGHDGIRVVDELIPERASRINITLREVQPMDEGAKYVSVSWYGEGFNGEGEMYTSVTALYILRMDDDEYKFCIGMFNRHNQTT